MLTIRKEQMEALSEYKTKMFEDRVVVRVNGLFPEECEALEEPEVREIVQYGIQQAEQYGIVSEGDVCLYIDLMFVFGRDMDKDPELLWANEILNNERLSDPTAKVNRLYDAGLEHQNAGKGIQHRI